ncbi:MAG: efflux RND transporter permease subunit [Thermoanaerobaculia bacterium]
MNLPKLAVGRPVTTIMVLLCVVILAGIALSRMKLAYLPEVDAPFIQVQIPYPNSNPTQVEKEITKPVEEVLATLPDVKSLNASSSADMARFFVEFDWGQDIDVVRMLVSEKMDAIKPSLPPGAGEILIFSFNTSDIPVFQARLSAQGVDLSKNYDLIEARVLNRLRRVPGVARVDLNGVEPREISIDLVLDRIKEHNVDVSGLIRTLQGASSNMVLGQVNDKGMRYTVRALGQFATVEEIENLVINERGLRVRDIAVVTYEEPPLTYGRHLDGKYAVALEAYKESTANTVDVVRGIIKVINEDIANDDLLQGINLFMWDNQAEEIVGGIQGISKAGAVGGLLAVLILYFFLRRLASTLIVSISIPFSILAAIGVMYFMGKTLNVLSMMGLMLGVGMLIDNAIVVLESIDRRQRTERDTTKASLEGASAVAMAVVASTATSLIVFLPLIVGGKSELTVWLGEVGIAISLALVCSLGSALLLIPLVAAHFLKYREPKPNPTITWLEDHYAGALGWTINHRWWTAAILLGVIALTVVPLATGLVKTGMFAAVKNERLYMRYEFADFTYKSDAERSVDIVEKYLNDNAKEFEVGGLYSWFTENEAATTITLAREGMTDDELKELRKKVREKLPEIAGVKIVFDDDSESGGSATSFAVKFFGQDSEVLQGLAEEAERRLATIEGIADVNQGGSDSRQEIQVVIDRDKAARLGLTAQDVSDIFGFTLGGMRLNRFNAGSKEVETWLALRIEDRTNVEDMRNMQVPGGDGRPVLLGDIAQFYVVSRQDEIRREDRKVRMAVRAVYEGEDWNKAKQAVTAQMDAFEMPPGYSWSWDDRTLESDTQGRDMGINMLLALALVYIVMASLFESLAQPFAILFSILFGLPGAIWMLGITRTPLNIMAQIGFLILMGIVVNNGIVLLDHLNRLRREGVDRHEAILMAGRDRLRPILMTALTTIISLLPLAIGGSNVSGLFYFPLARTIMGGLLSSTVLTLLILPYLDLVVEEGAEKLRAFWRTSNPKKVTIAEPASTEAATA